MADQGEAQLEGDLAWGDHPHFVELYESFLDAALGGETGRARLTGSIVAAIDEREARTILDCAAGTGFPCLDLKVHYGAQRTVHASDGDGPMIGQLLRRASDSGIDARELQPPREPVGLKPIEALVANWADLESFTTRYDYVLCRGNALAYADTWSGAEQVASSRRIRSYIAAMADRVSPGGHLHIDAPLRLERSTASHRVSPAHAVTIDERMRSEHGRREWQVTFESHDDDETVRFRRYSSQLKIDEVAALLDDMGFVETTRVQLGGERSDLGVIIARKTG